MLLPVSLGLLLLCLIACRPANQNPSETSALPSLTPPTQTIAPSPTPEVNNLYYLDQIDGWQPVVDSLQSSLETLSSELGLGFVKVDHVPEGMEFQGASLIVIIGDPGDVETILEVNEGAKLLLIASNGYQPSKRIAIIGPEGIREDKVAFMSGYVAALVTPNWRIAQISLESSGEGRAASTAFVNGGKFFCGLCRPSYPPFESYPKSLAIDSPSQEAVSSAVEQLGSQGITTIALPSQLSEALSVDVAANLQTASFLWVGPIKPAGAPSESWIASIQPDPGSVIREVITQLNEGQDDIRRAMPLRIFDIQPDILSEGKLRLVEAILEDLEQGIIDTGVDPLTGEER
jgi:hypothetical protein